MSLSPNPPAAQLSHLPKSPSKSSLRRGSSSKNLTGQVTQNRSPTPSAHFAEETEERRYLHKSPPNQFLSLDEDIDEHEDALFPSHEDYPAGDQHEYFPQAIQQPMVPFQPFFTLIEDVATGEHYHPTVHYIFADDEEDPITDTACHILAQEGAESPKSNSQYISNPSLQNTQLRDTIVEAQRSDSGPDSTVKEHYLILDLHPNSNSTPPSFSSSPNPKQYLYTIAQTSSLSSHFQITSVQIKAAPSMSDTSDQSDGTMNLMLRIEGRSQPEEEVDNLAQAKKSLDELVAEYQEKLDEIKDLMLDIDLDDAAATGAQTTGSEDELFEEHAGDDDGVREERAQEEKEQREKEIEEAQEEIKARVGDPT